MTLPLHRAVCINDIEYIKVLIGLDSDVNVETQDHLKMTPLHFAAISDSEYACEILLKAGAKPNRQAAKGLTPLHVTGLFRSNSSADALSRYKADFYAKTYDGFNYDKLYNKSYTFRKNYWDALDAPVDFATVVKPPIDEIPDYLMTSEDLGAFDDYRKSKTYEDDLKNAFCLKEEVIEKIESFPTKENSIIPRKFSVFIDKSYLKNSGDKNKVGDNGLTDELNEIKFISHSFQAMQNTLARLQFELAEVIANIEEVKSIKL